MTANHPLAIHPWPLPPEALRRVQQAFAALGAPFPVEPRPAVSGGPVRVLGLGSLPPFVCDAGLVKDPSNIEAIKKALRWVLDPSQPVEQGFTVLNYLDTYLGPGVVELEPEGPEQRVRFE